MVLTINIYIGTGLQTPETIEIDEVTTYQDIITKLIQAGYSSGQLYSLEGQALNNGSLIRLKEVNYVISEHESVSELQVRVQAEPPVELTIPYVSEMTYQDVYNYALAQLNYHFGFLRVHGDLVPLSDLVTETEDLTLDLGVLVYISKEGTILSSTYIFEASIYQDIISDLIASGQPSGRIFTVKSVEVDYSSPITEPIVHYIILMSEPTSRIPITIVGAPLYQIEVPRAPDMTYQDVYNYMVAEVRPTQNNMFLVTNNGRTKLTETVTEIPIFGFYELP